jgi:hypothetical protein
MNERSVYTVSEIQELNWVVNFINYFVLRNISMNINLILCIMFKL